MPGMSDARPGPKHKSPEKLRRNKVVISLTDAEYAQLASRADGDNIATIARLLLMQRLAA